MNAFDAILMDRLMMSLVLRIVMQSFRCSYQKAFDLVKLARPSVMPNDKFKEQLREWERRVGGRRDGGRREGGRRDGPVRPRQAR